MLDTDRMRLRLLREDDADALDGVFGDAEVMRFGSGVQSREAVSAWLQAQLAHYTAHGFGPWAVIEKATGDVIGYCGLFYYADVAGQPDVEVGYRLARKHWGRGFATEAVLAVRDYAFNALGLSRLIAMIDPANTASIRVAQKVGMHYEKDVWFEGYDHADHVYAVARG